MLVPRSWSEFQHYRDRRPPWIKLHREILNDPDFMTLPAATRGIAMMLWLLASESTTGAIEVDVKSIAFRLRLTEKEVAASLDQLIGSGLMLPASSVLADASSPLALASNALAFPSVSVSLSEGEGERREGEGAKKPPKEYPSVPYEKSFEWVWDDYDRKTEKKAALAAWVALAPSDQLVAVILDAAKAYAVAHPEARFRKHLHRWLKGRCWEDEHNGVPAEKVAP